VPIILTDYCSCGIFILRLRGLRYRGPLGFLHSAAFLFFRRVLVYLLYLDDSGSADNLSEKYLVLAGISVFERQIHFISRQLDSLAASINPSDPKSVEFHASEIYAGRNSPWNGMTRPERRDVINKVLNILVDSHASTHAFACAILKESYPSRDTMELAFEDLCSRFDMQLSRLYASGKQHKGLIILDKSSYETSLQNLAIRFDTEGTTWRQVKNIPEVPLFTDSRSSRLIQLADHIAYSVFRYYERDDNQFLKLILNKFDSEEGKLHGLAHKQTDDHKCMCPACMSRR